MSGRPRANAWPIFHGLNGLKDFAGGVFRNARVSGKHDRVPGIVDPISQRGLDCPVIDCKSCNFDSAALANNALFNILCFDDDPWRGYLLIDIASDVNVERIRLLQMFHHLPRPAGSPNPQRSFSPYDPSRQPQIGHSHDVIGMQVGQEQRRDFRKRHFLLVETLRAASPAIENQFLISSFHQGARPEALNNRPRSAGSEQGHLQCGFGCGLRKSRSASPRP